MENPCKLKKLCYNVKWGDENIYWISVCDNRTELEKICGIIGEYTACAKRKRKPFYHFERSFSTDCCAISIDFPFPSLEMRFDMADRARDNFNKCHSQLMKFYHKLICKIKIFS